MKRTALACSLFALLHGFEARASAHGAVFPPPPPPPLGGGVGTGAGGAGGGGTPGTAPVPPLGAPPGGGGGGMPGGYAGTPAPGSGPSTGPRAQPRGPASGGPGSPATSTGGPMLAHAPVTWLGGGGIDATSWSTWWEHNQARYLGLKERIHDARLLATGTGVATLGDEPRASLRPTPAQIAEVVPRLEALLADERHNDIVTGALVALAKIGGAEDLGSLHAFRARLSDPSQECAETAAAALGILGAESAIADLATLLADERGGRTLVGAKQVPDRTRAFAAYALGLIGERTSSDRTRQVIAKALTEALERRDAATAEVEGAVASALGLVRVDAETNEDAVAMSAAWVSRQSELRLLGSVLADPGRRTLLRAQAATALARLAADAPGSVREGTLRVLLDAVRPGTKPPNEVVQSVAIALGALGTADRGRIDAEVRATITRLVGAGDVQARCFALVALGEIGGRPGRGDGSEEGIRECRAFLLDHLVRGKSRMRTWSALVLGVQERGLAEHGRAASPEVREVLRSGLKTKGDGLELGAYAIALGLCRDAQASALLRARLESTSDDAGRAYFAVALGMIGDRDAIDPIRALVRGARYRPHLMRQASIALGLLGDKELAPELAKLLGEVQGLSAQASIASALGHVGDSRSIAPLLALLGRRELTASARAFAVIALGNVCDARRLPWSTGFASNVNYRAGAATLIGGDGTGLLEIL